MKTKTTLVSMAILSLIINIAAAEEIHSNVTINNAILNPPSNATFAVTSITLTAGTWDVRCLGNVRMVPTHPSHNEGLGFWVGVDSLRLDGYSTLQSVLFDTWSFLSCSAPGRIIVVPQGQVKTTDLLAATYYLPDRVATVQVWGYISAIKQP